MKAGGKKKKGKRLERKVAQLLRSSGLDPKARPSFQSGAQWAWKSDIYTSIPFSIECKNAERIRLWDFWEQAESQRKSYKPPVLMISSNFRPILATMKFEDWLSLVKELQDWRDKYDKKVEEPTKKKI